jgi:hypothetical protein
MRFARREERRSRAAGIEVAMHVSNDVAMSPAIDGDWRSDRGTKIAGWPPNVSADAQTPTPSPDGS